MADYIIAFDAYGQPYLAHAWGSPKNHKYLHREPDFYGPGKHLYLYTQKEVDAFKQGRKKGKRNLFQKIKDRSRDILGWDERSDRETAKEAQDSARNSYGAANRRTEQIKNQQRGNQRMASAAAIEQKNAEKNYRKATKEYRDAQDAYDKTFLGTIDKIKDRVRKHLDTSLSEVRQYNAKQESKEQNTANYNVFRDMVKTRNRRNMRENNPLLLKFLDEIIPTNFVTINTSNASTSSSTKPKEENHSTVKANQTYRERRIDEIDAQLKKIKTHDMKSANAEYSRALKELGVARKNHGEGSKEVKAALEKVARRRNEVEALNEEAKKLMKEKDHLNQQ